MTPLPLPRTLIVDRLGTASLDCARNLEEAVARLIGDEYDTIVVYTRDGREDAGLVEYLAGTWPEFLRRLTVRRVSADAVDVFDATLGRFVHEHTVRRSSRVPSPPHRLRERTLNLCE